jgi:NitT/TauT family transport system ATP-binding protein
LQSVPVLGYISFTVTFFLTLFPGRALGAELAAIFAIVTSQAWSMTFSFYHMPEIARTLQLGVDNLFPVAEVLQHLAFVEMREGDIFLTPPARVFAELGTQERKLMFAEHLLRHVPLATQIRKVLNERPGHRAPRVRFKQELEDFLSDSAAKETLDAVINWGRYGEIFSYNDKTELFSLADVES